MTLSVDYIPGLGTGLCSGVIAGIISDWSAVIFAGIGALLVAYAVGLVRAQRDETECDEVATDGGTARRETPEEAAPEQPTVLDVEIEGDRMLASAERGDISLVVEAPAGTSEEEISQTLSGVPESIEQTSKRFAETTTMSANTTEDDGSSAVEDTADDDFGGGA